MASPFQAVDTLTMRRRGEELRAAGEAVAFVPTMGALHEGHLSLMRRARELADKVVVSVFVNPTQFGPGEDFERYPRSLDRDARLVAEIPVDILWTPRQGDIYPDGYRTFIEPGELGTAFEGAIRPGHFRGVATVVHRLLSIVKPRTLVLGQKDAQQCVVVESMVRDLELPVVVERGPTVRDDDGVALSSRNAYLSVAERKAARALSDALRMARAAAAEGRLYPEIRDRAESRLRDEAGLEPQYTAVVNGDSFQTLQEGRDERALLIVAARVGDTRLIDNAWLHGADPTLDPK